MTLRARSRGEVGDQVLRQSYDARKLLAGKYITEALRNGLAAHIAKRHFLKEYTLFSDTIGSEFVGKATVVFNMVVKAGREEVKRQVDIKVERIRIVTRS